MTEALELLQELNKRNIRIETKITRLLTGESDKGVTSFDYEMDFVDNVWCLRLLSGGVNLKQISTLMGYEGIEVGEEVQVFVNGKYLLKVKI